MFGNQINLSLFIVALIIFAIFIGISLYLTKKRTIHLDKLEYQTNFLAIENTLARDNPLSYPAVVIDADKLLDKALCELGTKGNTMGERLRTAKDRFTQLNSVWHAHKLRNQLVHEHGYRIEYRQARHALDVFKQALIDLGAI